MMVRRFLHDRTASSAIEYGLLVTLIGIGLIGFLNLIGVDVAAFFTPVSDTL